MIKEVITGGQTGADQSGWRAAYECGIPTSGSMLAGFVTEEGPEPIIGRFFNAYELMPEYNNYRHRTQVNVETSDGTILFGNPNSNGSKCAISACKKFDKPILIVIPGETTPKEAARWIEQHNIESINVAGNRASQSPNGFGDKVKSFLVTVFKITNRQVKK